MGRLDGKIALVTGGSTGIGRAVVKRFIAEGARVGIMGRTAARLEENKADFGEAVATIQGTVTSYADCERAVVETVAAFGQLDVMVANAGIYDNFVKLRDVPTDRLEAAFDEMFKTNVLGYVFSVRAALPELEKTHGNVVLTASISSLAPGFGGIFYVPAKHAVAGLTRQLAFELAPNIRVNAVALGFVPTELGGLRALDQRGGNADPAVIVKRIPLDLIPDPDEVAGLYVTLASSETNRFVTGAVLLADGGQSTWGPPH
jgi:NAD(P)-dependent dehydrogenase (short-subunit alcohol dehydrogenase family)